MPAETQPSDDDLSPRLSEAIESYIAAVERGESFSPEQWALRYPDIADELRECLSALKLIQRASRSPSKEGEALMGPTESCDEETSIKEAGAETGAFGARGYTLLGEIGRGGMGVVYKALQHKTKRQVALKALHGDIHASPSARRRFEREVELAAALDHPGIVHILESGQVDGRDYYAMELVDGAPLQHWIANRAANRAPRPSTHQSESAVRAMLELFIDICDAVNYAHQRGVIHRDLKPTNIMVDQQGRPRILDFGLARTTDRAAENSIYATRTGQLVGTLPYLCPEQASGAGDQVDVRSDLYSLGVILYEMVTGRPPYDTGGPLDEALHNIIHTSPPRPSHYGAALKGDLDAIALKALEKAKEHRYQTAASFAEDLRCYLRKEPVEANRTNRFYLLRKVYARHRTQVHVAGAVFGMILVALTIILGLYFQVRQQRNQLNAELHSNELRRGLAHLAAGHDYLAETLLWKAYRSRPDSAALWSLISYFTQNPLVGRLTKTGWVTAISYSPDGRWLAYGNLAGELVLHDAASLACVHRIATHSGGTRAIAFSRSARRLVTGGADGRIMVWVAGTWQRDRELEGHSGGLIDVRFAAGRDRFISAGADHRIVVWDGLDDGAVESGAVFTVASAVTCADLSSAGDLIAASMASSDVILFDVGTGKPRRTILTGEKPAEAVRFSSDGSVLSVWCNGEISQWEVASGTKRWSRDAGLPEPRPTSLWDLPIDATHVAARPAGQTLHTCWRPTLEYSPDGGLLICTGWDATVRLWEARSGRSLGASRSHETAIYSAAFFPNSRSLAVGCVGNLRVWALDRYPGATSWPVESGTERVGVTVSQEKGFLAWAGASDGTVQVLATDRHAPARHLKNSTSSVTALAFSPDGENLACADQSGSITLRRTDDGRLIRQWSGKTERIWSLAFSPDGVWIASGGRDGMLRVWRCADGAEIQTWRAHPDQILCIAFGPEGRRLLTGGTDWMVRMWELGTKAPVAEWSHREWVNAVAFSGDGKLIASSGADLIIRIAGADGTPITSIQLSHAHWVNALVFLDEGRVLASGGNDGAIRFWDSQSGADLAMIPCRGAVQSLAATKDGRALVVGARGVVQYLDLGAARDSIRHQLSPFSAP